MTIEFNGYNKQFRKRIILTDESNHLLTDLLVKLDNWIIKKTVELAEQEQTNSSTEVVIKKDHIERIQNQLKDAIGI